MEVLSRPVELLTIEPRQALTEIEDFQELRYYHSCEGGYTVSVRFENRVDFSKRGEACPNVT